MTIPDAVWDRRSARSQLFDDRRQQGGVLFTYEVVNALLRQLEFLHRRRGALPELVAFFPFGQVEFGHQFGQALDLDLVKVLVIPLDDPLLVAGVVLEHETPGSVGELAATITSLYRLPAEAPTHACRCSARPVEPGRRIRQNRRRDRPRAAGLLGIRTGDTIDQARWLADKIIGL